MTTQETSPKERDAAREPDARLEPLEVLVINDFESQLRLAGPTKGPGCTTVIFALALTCIAAPIALLSLLPFEYAMSERVCAMVLMASVTSSLVVLALGLYLNGPPATWLRIGADGLLLRQSSIRPPKSGRLFIPYSTVESTGTYQGQDTRFNDRGMLLKFRDGKTFSLTLGERTTEVWKFLRDARVRFESAEYDGALPFGRGDRAVGDWIVALRKLESTPHDPYRGSQVTVEQMWRIVETPSAAPTARCGAAMALRAHLDEAGRERMLSAARGAVAPGVRDAMEAAASASTSEAVLTAALAEVDDRSMTPLA